MENSINELIEKLRLGEIDGTIEVTINNKGRINTIKIKKDKTDASQVAQRVITGPNLSGLNVSGMDISDSDFSNTILTDADFSYARIMNANMRGTYLKGSNFYKAALSQTDLSHSYHANTAGAYLTGSVNFYNAETGPLSGNTNPYDAVAFGDHDHGEHSTPSFVDDKWDPLRTTPTARRNY